MIRRIFMQFVVFFLLGSTVFGQAVDENLFVFISDVHIHLEPIVQQDVSTDSVLNFQKVVRDVLAMDPRPCMVILLGDLQHIGMSDVPYEKFRELLRPWDEAGVRYGLCMGNHDQPWRFFRVFPEWLEKTAVPGALVYDISTPNLDFVILETTDYKDGWYGKVGEKQKNWYDQRVARQPEKPLFVCGHHDWQLMREKTDMTCPNIQGWLCGHRHRFEQKTYTDGVLETIIPTTAHTDCGYNGYVVMRILENEYRFTLVTLDPTNAANGRTLAVPKK